jgi:adenylate kinase family enzyme
MPGPARYPRGMRAHGQGLREARRILVYGVTGSGKTTLAARLSELTGIGWTEVDSVTWQPGWVLRSEDEQRRRIGEVCDRDAWILDSAYGTWLDLPLGRAELVIALDYPRWLSLARLLRRTLARNIDRREICNGNVESWRQTFSSDSIVLWHFRSFHSKRRRFAAWEVDAGMPPVLRFRSPQQLESWLRSVRVERRASA